MDIGLFITGFVLGMGQTIPYPPVNADFMPVSRVSFPSPPGSRRWQCRSIKRGEIYKLLDGFPELTSVIIPSLIISFKLFPVISTLFPLYVLLLQNGGSIVFCYLRTLSSTAILT